MMRNLLVLTNASSIIFEGSLRPLLDALVMERSIGRYTVVTDGAVTLSTSGSQNAPFDTVLVYGRIDARSHLALVGLDRPYAHLVDGATLQPFCTPWGSIADRHTVVALLNGATTVWETRPGLIRTVATLADHPLAPPVANDAEPVCEEPAPALVKEWVRRGIFCLLPAAPLLAGSHEALFIALDKLARGYGVKTYVAACDDVAVPGWVRNLTNFGRVAPDHLPGLLNRLRGMLGVVPHDPFTVPSATTVADAIVSDIGDLFRRHGLAYAPINRLLNAQGAGGWLGAFDALCRDGGAPGIRAPFPTSDGADPERFAARCLDPVRSGAPFTLPLFTTLRDFAEEPEENPLHVVAPPLQPYVKRPPVLQSQPAGSPQAPVAADRTDPAHYRPLFVGRLPSMTQGRVILDRLNKQVDAAECFLSERGL